MNQTTHKMTDPIQIKHYKEDITSFNQLYKEFQRRFVRFANTYVRDLTTAEDITEGGNLAASKIRNLECPSYEICLIDYGCGKFNRKIHIMEQYP